jgi:hypothetical protein
MLSSCSRCVAQLMVICVKASSYVFQVQTSVFWVLPTVFPELKTWYILGSSFLGLTSEWSMWVSFSCFVITWKNRFFPHVSEWFKFNIGHIELKNFLIILQTTYFYAAKQLLEFVIGDSGVWTEHNLLVVADCLHLFLEARQKINGLCM